ncbi:hypothetical protein M1141_01395 [Candidatus Marsarchaeota archaeon]|nr:hypothetical protein [Candidatus Marsarchaeota archaeon]
MKLNASPSGKGARQTTIRVQLNIPPTHARLNTFDMPKYRIRNQKQWKTLIGYGFNSV